MIFTEKGKCLFLVLISLKKVLEYGDICVMTQNR